MITISEEMLKKTRIIKDMKAINMSVGSKTVMEDMDSLGIAAINHVGPSGVLHAIKRVIDMQTTHTRT